MFKAESWDLIVVMVFSWLKEEWEICCFDGNF